MVFRLLCLLCVLAVATANAQTTVGLVAHYSFDGDLNDNSGNTSNTGIAIGTPTFTCGVVNQAVLLDGANDQIRILNSSSVATEFDREDFTISFYFKPVGYNGVQYLMSKRDTSCANPRQFYVRYVPTSRTINSFFAQDADKDVNLVNIVNNESCWQHLALVRENLRIKVFLNGEFQSDLGTASRVDLDTEGPFYIGGSECIGGFETPFSGLIDEVRVYDRALDNDEITDLYFGPDQIITADTIVFQGNDFQVDLSTTCGTSFNWSPADNVYDADDKEPLIEAAEPGDYTYYVQITDQVSTCVAIDSFRLTVVDPNTLPCKVAMAKAFSPNRDNLNDTYGLSNPFAITDLVSLEIFDRWGSRVFATNDPFSKWDGTSKGQKLNPGVFLWRASYKCNGELVNDTGTVTMIR